MAVDQVPNGSSFLSTGPVLAVGGENSAGNTVVLQMDASNNVKVTLSGGGGNSSVTNATVLGVNAVSTAAPNPVAVGGLGGLGNLQFVRTSFADSSADTNAPNSNTAATLNYAANATMSHLYAGVTWSYNSSPIGGNLQISDNGTVVMQFDITAAGPGFVTFVPPKKTGVNSYLLITLAAGGANVAGKVNVMGHATE